MGDREEWMPGESNWDPKTWRQLVDYSPKLENHLRLRISEEDAKDAAQTAYVRALQSDRNQGREPQYVPAYLQVVGMRQHLQEQRKKRPGPSFRDAETEKDFWERIPDKDSNLDAALHLRKIRESVANMSANYQEVFRLYFEEGHSIEETASLRGKEVAGTKTAIFRIRERLREEGLIPEESNTVVTAIARTASKIACRVLNSPEHEPVEEPGFLASIVHCTARARQKRLDANLPASLTRVNPESALKDAVLEKGGAPRRLRGPHRRLARLDNA